MAELKNFVAVSAAIIAIQAQLVAMQKEIDDLKNA